MLQNSKNSKYRKILLACVLVIALALLVSGLQDLEIQGAVTIRERDNSGDMPEVPLPSYYFIIAAFIVISVLLVMVVMLYPRRRKIILLAFFTLFILFVYLQPAPPVAGESTAFQEATPPVLTGEAVQPGSQPEIAVAEGFVPPQISSFLLYLVSFLVVISLMAFVWMLYRWQTTSLLVAETRSLEEIGEAARLALNDLAAGVDEKDAVIACYARMSEIVLRSRNIERGASRTATEFAVRLETAGLPGSSVQRLTRLFETARYGSHASSHIDAEEARACLWEIAVYCEEAA